MSTARTRLLGAMTFGGILWLAGCVGLDANIDVPGQTARTLLHQGIERSYQLFVPTDYDGSAVPLVLAFHGRFATGREMSRMTGFNAVAARDHFIVAYPDAVNGIWNDGRDSAATVDDVGYIRALIDQLRGEFNIDARRIYATGYSNGGHMVNRLALQMPGTFAAIAPVASLLGRDLPFLSPPPTVHTPILIIHGTSDPVTPFAGGASSLGFGTVLSATATIDYWVAADAASSQSTTEALPDTDPSDGTIATRETHAPLSSQGAEVIFVRVDGGGHTWPGASQALSSILVGATSRDFSATETIWAFFSRHVR